LEGSAGRFSEARGHLVQAIQLAREANTPTHEFFATSLLLRMGLATEEEERRLFDELANRPSHRLTLFDRASTHFDCMTTALQWGDIARAEAERLALARLQERENYRPVDAFLAGSDALHAKLAGRLQEALALSRAAQIGTFPHVWATRIAGWLGDIDAAQEELTWFDKLSGSVYFPINRALAFSHVGRLDEAAHEITRMPDLIGPESTPPAYSYLTLLLESVVAIGDRALALSLLEQLQNDGRMLAKPNFVLVPRLLGGAAELLGDIDGAHRHYESAISFCEEIGYRPELAIARMELGVLLLQHFAANRSEALDHLAYAEAEFEAMGMVPLLERVRATLSSAGERRTYPAGLSEREVEVVRLLCRGRSNRQIADELVISVNTVLRHVSHIYAKTGATNRVEASLFAGSHGLTDDTHQVA
jgi:DNA-binding CsgD family transcriptional regulator